MSENHVNGAPSSAMVGFLVGAIIGAGVALLVAPATGADTRRRLTDTARRLGKGATNKLSEVKDSIASRASELKSDLNDAVETGRAAATKSV
jgi:gas vesicle protein